MKNIKAIILAAGRGTRMKTEVPKVLHLINNKPMAGYLIDNLKSIGVKDITLVLGYGKDAVRKRFKGIKFVTQKKLLGSADAIKEAKKSIRSLSGNVIIAYGDTPFVFKGTLKKLIRRHGTEKAACTLLTGVKENPFGFGRILRDAKGDIFKVVEEKDASSGEKNIKEVNTGYYCFNAKKLFKYIKDIKMNKKKKEYYLTDIVDLFQSAGEKITSITSSDELECMGINSREELAIAGGIMRERALKKFMASGVTILHPGSTFIAENAKIGKDTVIEPHTIIEDGVIIGKRCHIGPFARIRPGTRLEDNVEVGNFVELVRAKVGKNTKVKHMTYLGDAVVGSGVNIGAGTITANYDGKNKNRTMIGKGAFIGVGAILIAPVKVGTKAMVGAGSVVTKNKNVPSHKTVAGVPARILRGGN